jgi:hypothetical protein
MSGMKRFCGELSGEGIAAEGTSDHDFPRVWIDRYLILVIYPKRKFNGNDRIVLAVTDELRIIGKIKFHGRKVYLRSLRKKSSFCLPQRRKLEI